MIVSTNKISVDSVNKDIRKLKDADISVKDVTDGYHSFEELYYHRTILFSVILNSNESISWKSKLHHDGTMFSDDLFICGIETPEGQYTYHCKLKYWDYFNVKELDRAPKFDGHQPNDIDRLLSL